MIAFEFISFLIDSMISKTEELRNTLDIIKEEKYNLQLELSRFKK